MLQIFVKIVVIAGFVFLWRLTQKWIGKKSSESASGIEDLLHQWTAPWYRAFARSERAADWLLISSSLVIDALGVFLILRFLFGDTVRPLLGLIILFTLRQANQAITTLPAPAGMIWRDPGVPSLFVTYGVSNDLFFSGHTALAVFGAFEIAHLGGWPCIVLGVLVALFEISVVILLRAHWTMDVFAGIATALLTGVAVDRWAPFVDRWIMDISRL